MNITFTWQMTTKGYIGKLNGRNKWFIRKDKKNPDCWEVFEIVSGYSNCLLRSTIRGTITDAKRDAYYRQFPFIKV